MMFVYLFIVLIRLLFCKIPVNKVYQENSQIVQKTQDAQNIQNTENAVTNTKLSNPAKSKSIINRTILKTSSHKQTTSSNHKAENTQPVLEIIICKNSKGLNIENFFMSLRKSAEEYEWLHQQLEIHNTIHFANYLRIKSILHEAGIYKITIFSNSVEPNFIFEINGHSKQIKIIYENFVLKLMELDSKFKEFYLVNYKIYAFKLLIELYSYLEDSSLIVSKSMEELFPGGVNGNKAEVKWDTFYHVKNDISLLEKTLINNGGKLIPKEDGFDLQQYKPNILQDITISRQNTDELKSLQLFNLEDYMKDSSAKLISNPIFNDLYGNYYDLKNQLVRIISGLGYQDQVILEDLFKKGESFSSCLQIMNNFESALWKRKSNLDSITSHFTKRKKPK
jgi:hypothetical protein